MSTGTQNQDSSDKNHISVLALQLALEEEGGGVIFLSKSKEGKMEPNVYIKGTVSVILINPP